MVGLVGSILEVIKVIGRPAVKYLNYHRKFKDYEDGFKQAQEKLQDREGDIQQQLRDELHFGKKPKQEVQNWLRIADEKIGHARGVEDKVRKGKYLFRSCLGKDVDETTQAMNKVIGDSAFSGSLVVNDPSATTTKLLTTELEGGSNVTEEIYKYLTGDEVRMIGVCGMGGIGKTTILQHVYNRLLEETQFSKLIWTTVSQDFDARKLQKSIACQLKEDLSDDEETTIRAAILSEMLRKQGRYVLMLDDVWNSFSLKDVGILEPTADNGNKLVLTTRSEEVVRSMGCRKVQVACLSTDEATQLFRSKVGPNIFPNPTLESIMKLIVGECDGLPLAIVTVAGCMRGMSDPILWENALNELRGCIIRSIHDMEDKVFGCLRFSYDRLRQIDQDCFLCCALYPEDHEIVKEQIIEYWMEEGLIDEMGTRKAMQGCGHSILQKLEENCFLERVEDEDTCIKMHDVVIDMALHVTRKRVLVKAGMQLEELPNEEYWTEDLEKVSLMKNCISTIPQTMKSPKFQKLTTLFLSENRLKKIPESFFEHTPNLKILDLSGNPIVNLPNSISNLENLTALSLRHCNKLVNLPSLSKLQALKKLNLELTQIKEIPQGLEMLVKLRYLNLGATMCLKEIPNGLLSKLCGLQILKIHAASVGAKEIRELNKLEVFEGCFSNVCDLNMYANAPQRKRLHRYFIWVGQSWIDDWILYFGLPTNYNKKVFLRGFDINSGDGIMLPDDIQQLGVFECEGMRSLKDICGSKGASDLKECAIKECDDLESIFSSGCQVETLECLNLAGLRNLKGIGGEASVGTFSSLKEIYLYRCAKIKKLFSDKWVLHNLKVIEVHNCQEMEEIIASEEEGMGTNNNTIKYTLPKLSILVYSNLPNLKSICRKNGVMVCDSLRRLWIEKCPKLKRIPLYLPLLDPDKEKPSPPPSLKEISVDPKEWWESVEWDHPDAKNVLQPFLRFYDDGLWKQAV